MDELIKKTQTVLIYQPGMGGEYISVSKSSMTDTDLVNEDNRYFGVTFPQHPFLSSKATELPPLPGEFISEQRLTFKTQQEGFDYLCNFGQDPYFGGRDLGRPELNNAWLFAHWHFGVWEDHWRWIDWDNDNWPTHWSICSGFKHGKLNKHWFKQDPTVKLIEGSIKKSHGHARTFDYFNGGIDNIKKYREYYRKHFPNNSFNIDREDGESVNYKDWAKTNIQALHKQYAYKKNIISDEILKKFYNVI